MSRGPDVIASVRFYPTNEDGRRIATPATVLAVQRLAVMGFIATAVACGSRTELDIVSSVNAASPSAPATSSGSATPHGWINRTAGTSAKGHAWSAVVSDASGSNLLALGITAEGTASELWTSNDGGTTWANRWTQPNSAYLLSNAVASDATGTHLLAGCSFALVQSSADGGKTWTNHAFETFSIAGATVASDGTGTQLVGVPATDYGMADLWTSTDSGQTWVNRTAGSPAGGGVNGPVASDATGTHLVVADMLTNDLWTSPDAGTTWTKRTLGFASNLALASVASNAAGDRSVVAASATTAGGLRLSSDFGATWTSPASGPPTTAAWTAVASDALGDRLIAGSDRGGVWTSTDFGVTWSEQTGGLDPATSWQGVASDASGTHLVAVSGTFDGDFTTVADTGDIWTN